MTKHAHIFLIRFRLYLDISHLTSSGMLHQSREETEPHCRQAHPVQPNACFHDAFVQMRPGVRFHSSDDITQDEGAPT